MTRISKTKEERFREWLRYWLNKGEIPTPTNCLFFLNKRILRTKHAQGGPGLGGPYSAIRIEEFEKAGLVKVNGKWRFPQ